MPFTIGGDWIPSEPEESQAAGSGKPVKVRSEKRGKALVTVVLNLSSSKHDLKELASQLKKRCGSGGTVKGEVIEIQGDHIEDVRVYLRSQGIKAQ